MKMFAGIIAKQDKLLKILAGLIIALGIIIRIVVYLQNRNLFIDEANLARNIYEKGFLELLHPLDYEQYAPPLFLWILKISTLLFGYSEYAFRIYPLLAGIGTLFVLFFILKEITSFRSLWYPLFLMATAFMFVKFSSELKQHGCDMLVTLSLILLTLKTGIVNTKTLRFMVLWCVAGSIAIWISMPSVFVLAGVGISYLYTSVRHRDKQKIFAVIFIGLVWIAQFLLYYLSILKQQANSGYIQDTLREYFFILTPSSLQDLEHNLKLFLSIVNLAAGFTFIALVFNLLLIFYAAIQMFIKNKAVALLIVIPVVCTFLASGFHQYAILERYILFLTPLFIILIGYGFEMLLFYPYKPLKISLIVLALICAKNHNKIEMLFTPYRSEQVTDELIFLKQNNISGSQLYVSNGARPAFIYYLQIHPEKQQWAQFKDAHLLTWNINYDSLASQLHGRVAFIYTALSTDELKNYRDIIEKHLKLSNYIENSSSRCYAYIYK